jgi:peptide deformylase
MKINDDTIIKDNDPLIRSKSKDVKIPLSDEDKEIFEQMLYYVRNSTNEEIAEKENLKPAVGISAIQFGVAKKMIVICIRNENDEIEWEYALANPKLISASIEKAYLGGGEGCLSVPEAHEGYVYRARRIKIKAYSYLDQKEVQIKATGYPAIVLQHEMDHLNGTLYYDHINPKNPFYEDEKAFRIE